VGLIKKAAKGTLAVSTLGASVAAEKAIKAGTGAVRARGTDVTDEEAAAGVLFAGMSHESGRNSKVMLYADRIERIQERSRMSMSKAHQDTEVTPIKAVASVQAKKDGMVFTDVTVYATGNNIDFRFKHDDAQVFKDTIMGLILAPTETAAPVVQQAAPDVAEQIKKLADLRDAGVVTEEEFQAKKTDLLAKM
jgi:hypothetical protein